MPRAGVFLDGRLAALGAGVFVLVLFVEAVLPLRARHRPRLERWRVNLGLALPSAAVAGFLLLPAALAVSDGVARHRIGLVQWLRPPWIVEGILAFLLMDLSFYYWHLANHRIRLLWRFHCVHHVDPEVDATTALRFHVGEILLSIGFRVVQIGAFGVAPWIYLTYEAAFQASTLLQHSNLRLPIGIERALNRVLVTPRMHGIHHSVLEVETNSNFSVVFPWWDRLLGTLRLNVPQRELQIGLPAYRRPEDNRLGALLAQPFQPQRDPWRFPDGTRPSRSGASTGDAFALAE